MVAVRKTSRREHDTPKKARFWALVEDAGWSGRMAAKKVKVDHSTASRWLKQASERRTGKFRPGRPNVLTEAQLDRIEKWFEGYYEHRIMNLQDIIQEFDLRCSPSTLLRALHKRGFHTHTPELKEWLSPKVKEQRLAFALQYRGKKKYFWRKGIFTDESTFNTRILRRLKVWRKKGDRHRLDCVQFKFHQG